jgi:hypothetical protein
MYTSKLNFVFYKFRYNNPKNYGTIRKTLPEKYDYLCSTFSADKFRRFEKFYKENKNTSFSLDDALFSYCLSDVNILADGLVAMRKEYYKITSLDLFESITLASAVMRHYRINHMPENVLLNIIYIEKIIISIFADLGCLPRTWMGP